MEKEVQCQTEEDNLYEQINVPEKINDLLVEYTKNIILHNPSKGCENEKDSKMKIYEWSRDYFKKKLLEDNTTNNIISYKNIQVDNIDNSYNSSSIKNKIEKEMERINFKI
ncbi:hypothetical protein PGSY75_0627000 [Plasmodium gaboni]|uniref:Uncharacterized protein n=1 Tax=Plasmodium gaboni TaxID=647221 RepID=A0A151LS02_9APIC|nr:hypothetical protein PGSY75_0627000 [Plasmodium gaboni]KYO01965.1 hypothetical protein PGSY75_0627000 [Plasmodium gaboni]